MQAIILAAGMGSRLGNLTEVHPKCMVEVDGVSMIERMLRQLDRIELDRIVIVTGYEHKVLKDFIGGFEFNTPIEYINNDIYDKTNNIYSLYLAKDILVSDNTLLFESDLIFEDKLLMQVVDNPADNAALVAKYEAWMDGTVVTLDNNQSITNFIGKTDFNYSDVDSYYKTVNIYKLSKNFSETFYVPFLESYMKAAGVNVYYESALKFVVDVPGVELKAIVNNNYDWYEVDDVQDLDIATVMFASSTEKKLELMQRRFGGYWRYPRLIDFCYLVNPFYPNERLLDEVKSNFSRLVRDYPSGMAVNTLLAAKHFGVDESSIVIGNGASELIKSLMEKLSGNIGIITPTFEEYPNRSKHLNVINFETSKIGYQYSSDSIMEYFKDKELSSLLLINPDNPSGNFIAYDDVIRLLDWCVVKNIDLILDESFIDFVDFDGPISLLNDAVIAKYPNLYLVKSISKSYGVPGFRLGVLATSDKQMIATIKKDVSIWNINSFGEYYMQIVDKYKKDFKAAMIRFVEVRKEYVEKLNAIPNLKVFPSQANFIMIEILNGITSKYVTEELLERGNVFIKDLTPKSGFDGQYIRVAVKRPEENEQLVARLDEIMNGGHNAS